MRGVFFRTQTPCRITRHKARRAAACRSALLAAILLLLPLSVQAETAKVQEVVAPQSGITAWLVEDTTLPMFSLRLAFTGAGAISDETGREGRAAMASDLLLEGAGTLQGAAFREALQDKAIELEFHTDEDHAYADLKSLSEHGERAFELLALTLTAPRFDLDAVERVRARQITTLKKLEERASYVAGRELRQRLYEGHPYGRPQQGTEASVASLTETELAAWPREFFAKNNLILAVAGDMDAATLARLIDRYFGALPTDVAAPVTVPDATPRWFTETVTIERAIPQAVVRFALPSLKRNDPDFYALYLMNHILGGGTLTSRLARAIREDKGLAYYANSYLDIQRHSQLIAGQFGTRNSQANDALNIMKDVLQTATEKGFAQKELENARDYVTGSFALRLDSTAGLADYLLIMQLQSLGRDYLEKRNGYFNAVTLEDVQRAAARTLATRAPSVVIVGQPQ